MGRLKPRVNKKLIIDTRKVLIYFPYIPLMQTPLLYDSSNKNFPSIPMDLKIYKK